MVQTTWPLADQEVDAVVSEAMWSGHFQAIARAGVLGQPGATGLRVTSVQGPNREVLVEAGRGTIRGFAFDSSSQEKFNLAANTSGVSRIDLAVLRYDTAEPVSRRIRLAIVQGSPGGGVPALTRNATVYDIRLGTLTVAANAATVLPAQLADTREFSDAPVVPFASIADVGQRVPNGGISTSPNSAGPGGVRAYVQTPNGPVPIVEPFPVVDFAPRLIAAATGEVGYGAGGFTRGWWANDPRGITDVEAVIEFGENPNGGIGIWSMPLPAGFVNASNFWVYLDSVLWTAQTNQHYVGKFAVAPGAGAGEFLMPRGDKPYVSYGTNVLRQVPWLTQARNEDGTRERPLGPESSVPMITSGPDSPRLFPVQRYTRLTVSGRLRAR